MHKPEGYKELLVYKRADELRDFVFKITEDFPQEERRRKEHMRDSSRSVKQNIVEGWKRSTTSEYHDFLSFSIGSLAEIREDGEDSFKDGLITRAQYDELMNRCRELDFLLNRLQLSLKNKMEREGTLPQKEKFYQRKLGVNQQEKDFNRFLENQGFKKMEDGRYIQGETGDKG